MIKLGSREVTKLYRGTREIASLMKDGRQVFGSSYDADAADYFDRIATAGSSISDANKTTVNDFVVGCKTDGIWSAIKASCLLAGPGTLAGALVPLVGSAPTNYNFVEADYDVVNGITTDSTAKYIDTNYDLALNPDGDSHVSAFQTTLCPNAIAGSNKSSPGASTLFYTGQCRAQTTALFNAGTVALGFVGHSRASTTDVDYQNNTTSATYTVESQAVSSQNLLIFRYLPANLTSSGRISLYSTGNAVDLSALNSRIAAYMAALT